MKTIKLLSLLINLPFIVSCASTNMVERYNYFQTAIYFHFDNKEINKKEVNDIKEKLHEIDQQLDNYSFSNALYDLNHTNEEIEIPYHLYHILNDCLSYQPITKGYFNPLVGSLSKKWKQSLNNKEILSSDIIEEELAKINNSSFILKEENSIYKAKRNGEAEIDLGAIAKGYALNYLKDELNDKADHFILNLGFSSILLGQKDNKDGYYNVGLNIPNLENTYYIKAKNISLGASGVSEQGQLIDEIMYSHIVNPFNGSVINNYDYVLVISDNPTLADVLSTSFMMMELEDIKEIEEKEDTKVIIYKDKNLIYKSDGVEVKKI